MHDVPRYGCLSTIQPKTPRRRFETFNLLRIRTQVLLVDFDFVCDGLRQDFGYVCDDDSLSRQSHNLTVTASGDLYGSMR